MGITSETILKKLSTRNILALAYSGTFLYLVIFGFTHGAEIVQFVEDHPVESALVTGLIGALITKVSDIVTFYFRKSQSKESVA